MLEKAFVPYFGNLFIVGSLNGVYGCIVYVVLLHLTLGVKENFHV